MRRRSVKIETDEDGFQEFIPETEEDLKEITRMEKAGEIDTRASFGDQGEP
jgi:hypothetical protein